MAIISNGTTIADAGAFSASLGSMIHIKTLTASSSGTLSFVDGTSSVVFDDTYPIYRFVFINIHPSSHHNFSFNVSIDSGSSYGPAKTSTSTSAYHAESGSAADYYYILSGDLPQGTGFQEISGDIYTDDDNSMSGTLELYNPSSTTFVKHFIGNTQRNSFSVQGYSNNWLTAGYANTTSAIDAIQFKMTSGNIDSGIIKMYGIKDS
tara:strand:+ start:50 stop:670 length:621 start_codon:yes stop_codon:yes gene_type:complete